MGRRAFTLVELLVTVAIIAILAGLALGVIGAANTKAKIARTQATITKLDNVIAERMEAYRTRRLPVDLVGLAKALGYSDSESKNARVQAKIKLTALRDLIRMEMPDRPEDINDPPIWSSVVSDVNLYGGTPAAQARYQRWLNDTGNPPTDDYLGAEIFYLVVCSSDPEVRGQFHSNEVTDTDGDGSPEFVDGWGNPIRWLRWAVKFEDSQIQFPYPTVHPDPFDTLHVEEGVAFATWPLIYSAGPDGIYDIDAGVSVRYAGTPPWLNPFAFSVGRPMDLDNLSRTAPGSANGQLNHHDNITNHGRLH